MIYNSGGTIKTVILFSLFFISNVNANILENGRCTLREYRDCHGLAQDLIKNGDTLQAATFFQRQCDKNSYINACVNFGLIASSRYNNSENIESLKVTCSTNQKSCFWTLYGLTNTNHYSSNSFFNKMLKDSGRRYLFSLNSTKDKTLKEFVKILIDS